MFVIDNLSADTLDKIVRKHIDKDTVIVSDGSSSHINFEGYFKGMNGMLKAMWILLSRPICLGCMLS